MKDHLDTAELVLVNKCFGTISLNLGVQLFARDPLISVSELILCPADINFPLGIRLKINLFEMS